MIGEEGEEDNAVEEYLKCNEKKKKILIQKQKSTLTGKRRRKR